MATSRFVEVTDEQISEIKINSVPKTQTICVKILKQLFASGAVIIGEYSPRLRFRTNYRMDFIYIKEYTNEDEFSKV